MRFSFAIVFLVPACFGNDNDILLRKSGRLGSEEFALYFQRGELGISPWHDIPLMDASNNDITFITTTPRFGRARMGIDSVLPYNPLKKAMNLRAPTYWNWGVFPRTWCVGSDGGALWVDGIPEKAETTHETLQGEKDLLDVIEVGPATFPIGSVKQVKVGKSSTLMRS